MGRGLSDLQRTMLRLAYKNYLADPYSKADVFYPEVLVAHYGWHDNYINVRRYHSRQIFSKAKIGARHYNAATVAVYRAALRLEQRGLVVCVRGAYAKWAGVKLTDEGKRLAQQFFKNEKLRGA